STGRICIAGRAGAYINGNDITAHGGCLGQGPGGTITIVLDQGFDPAAGQPEPILVGNGGVGNSVGGASAYSGKINQSSLDMRARHTGGDGQSRGAPPGFC